MDIINDYTMLVTIRWSKKYPPLVLIIGSLGVKSADCKALLFAGSPGESLGEGWEQERQDKKFSLSSEKFSVHCH